MGESNPPASSMKLEARTPILALKETAKQHMRRTAMQNWPAFGIDNARSERHE